MKQRYQHPKGATLFKSPKLLCLKGQIIATQIPSTIKLLYRPPFKRCIRAAWYSGLVYHAFASS